MMSNINILFQKPHLVVALPSKFLFPHTNKPSLTLPTTFLIPHFSTISLSYGPSLRKGTTPSQSPPNQNDALLSQEAFIRVFHLAALRVPSAECSALERRLRGHLLNWPRLRNIARVPGDDLDPDLAPLLEQPINADNADADVLSPVLYRERLARTFNSRGFVKFRNLAKISRPNRNKKRRKTKEESDGDVVKRVGENGFAAVEVVEELEQEEEEGGGLGNLLGEEFARGKWRGSTRLLLLDERYAGRTVEDLPEAIKVLPLFFQNSLSSIV